MNFINNFAGFYCSPEEKAEYSDDKLVIRFLGVLILFIFIVWAYKAQKTWQKILIVIAGIIIAGFTTIYLELSRIPLGC